MPGNASSGQACGFKKLADYERHLARTGGISHWSWVLDNGVEFED